MKTLYLECNMGAAGDMLTAALLELVPDKEASLARINAMGLPGVEVRAEPVGEMWYHRYPCYRHRGWPGGRKLRFPSS